MRRWVSSIMRAAMVMMGVVLLGIALLPTFVHADERWCDDKHQWKRVWGANAYDTMEAVLGIQDRFLDGAVEHVIIATGDGYWDALAAAGLAGVNNTAIVITPSDHLCTQARDELLRMRPHHVYIAGGRAAVSDEVESEVKTLLDIPTGSNIRLSGKTASDTAIALFKAGSPLEWNKGNTHNFCIIATTNGYWDALSIAPLAYSHRIPIFLADYDSGMDGYVLSDNTLDALKIGDFDFFIIVGGKAAVSDAVIPQLQQLESEDKTISIERWCGATAIDTSRMIAKMEIDYFSMSVGNMMVATSNGYWDALTAAPVAGKLNSVLVLMDPLCMYHEAFDEVFDKDEVGIGYILGGKMAISEGAEGYIVSQSM